MKTRSLAIALLAVGLLCSCREKDYSTLYMQQAKPGGHRDVLGSTIVVQITLDPTTGECVQKASINGGAMTPFSTYVPTHEGDFITWNSTFAAPGTKAVFFPNGANSGFPGTPMYDNRAGNWVRGFASANTALDTTTSLTGPEGTSFNFPYSKVLVLDPTTRKPTGCTPPFPEQGMGVQVTK